MALYRDKCEAALLFMAPLMDRLPASCEASVFYDVLSGGIVWTDESPNFRAVKSVQNWGVIRFLFRFRTTLILGEPNEDLRFCWDRGLELFPNWPGFNPQRRVIELSSIVRDLELKGNALFTNDS